MTEPITPADARNFVVKLRQYADLLWETHQRTAASMCRDAADMLDSLAEQITRYVEEHDMTDITHADARKLADILRAYATGEIGLSGERTLRESAAALESLADQVEQKQRAIDELEEMVEDEEGRANENANTIHKLKQEAAMPSEPLSEYLEKNARHNQELWAAENKEIRERMSQHAPTFDRAAAEKIIRDAHKGPTWGFEALKLLNQALAEIDRLERNYYDLDQRKVAADKELATLREENKKWKNEVWRHRHTEEQTAYDLKAENAQLHERLAKMRHQNGNLLAACKAMHNGMDVLFAMLIQRDPTFFPTKSGVWDAIVQGHEAIKAAEEQE